MDKRDDPGRFMLSQVTGACVLSKIKGLAIELYVVGSSHLLPELRKCINSSLPSSAKSLKTDCISGIGCRIQIGPSPAICWGI